MTSKESLSPARIAVKRLMLWTATLLPIVFLLLTLWVRLERHIPDWYYWKAALILLLLAKVAYTVSLTIVFAGTPFLGYALVRTNRMKRRQPVFARALLLCTSLVLASLAAEAACAIWQHRTRSQSVMPVGGLPRETGSAPKSRFRARSRM